jgi:hypothetical protein
VDGGEKERLPSGANISFMGKAMLGVILATMCAQAQPFQNLLLPQARHIVGMVIHQEGKVKKVAFR